MKKALITGITGFAGSHLAELLVHDKDWQVFGIHATDRHLDNLSSIKDKIHLSRVNLLDAQETNRVISEVKPDIIFHLAAAANAGDSFKKAAEFITNNSTSQINIFEAVKENNLSLTKLIVISSAHIYGLIQPSDLPINEEVHFNPDNPYSVSKITQDYLGLCYYSAYQLPIVRLRPFNHIGPRLSPDLSISRFAKKVAEIEKGLEEPIIRVGNLEAKRDFTDVRDMVRAYVLAAEKCTDGKAYNIGTGVSYKIGDILDMLITMANLKIEIQPEESLFRPSDIPELRCDASKFTQATGWEPVIKLEQTLQDMLAYWREIV